MCFNKERFKKQIEILKSDVRSPNLGSDIFWLLVCIFGIPILCFFIPFPLIPYWVSIPFIFILVIWGVPQFGKKIEYWKIYKSPSAVFYLYWALFFMPLNFCLFLTLQKETSVYKELVLFSGIFWLVGAAWYFFIPKAKIKEFDRFSSEAVGKDRDEFSMAESAKNNADGVLRLKKHVSVVSLDADIGFGKSSFVRMMIESINPSEILYTYISLTETNDSADFSHLFTERWLETLNERYPRLINSPNPHLELLSDIVRENKEYFVAGVFLKWLKGIDIPLFKTSLKVADPFLNFKRCFVLGKIGRMFGGIPDIKEKKWIIVIDDFERCPIDEIYRVIEIIERFKLEGRNGLPVHLVFLLCFAGTNLKNLLNVDKKNERADLAFLVDQFLLSDRTKSIDKSINLPPVSALLLKQYIINRSNRILEQI